MIRHILVLSVCLQSTTFGTTTFGATTMVESAKQQLQLSDSYLPVGMQIIAHLTDQMAYEAKDDPISTSKPTPKPTNRPTSNRPTSNIPTSNRPTSYRPTSTPTRPSTNRPPSWTTSKPYVWMDYGLFRPKGNAWAMSYGLLPYASSYPSTPFHRPGLFAPMSPPKPSSIRHNEYMLLPFDHNVQYSFIEPEEPKTNQPLLSIHEEEVKPLVEPAKDSGLLPPHFDADVDKISRSEDDDESEDNLQYLSQNVRDMIKMARDPNDDRLIDVWEEVRANKHEVQPKGKLSCSNLRLLMLYDLLSREAKRLRLSDYSGFSPSVLKALADSAGGGARAQLSMALTKMVERRDCEHEYANNRAKEMVTELGKDESKLSSEIRYLQPLVYELDDLD